MIGGFVEGALDARYRRRCFCLDEVKHLDHHETRPRKQWDRISVGSIVYRIGAPKVSTVALR
jgi:hypothetical protein